MALPPFQIVFGANGFAELLLLEDGKIRRVVLHLDTAPWAPTALRDLDVVRALGAWSLASRLPDAVTWEQLEVIFIDHGISVAGLVERFPSRGIL
jgi:hypothetical protein